MKNLQIETQSFRNGEQSNVKEHSYIGAMTSKSVNVSFFHGLHSSDFHCVPKRRRAKRKEIDDWL